ncbi:tyrosine-protein phosphatase [Kitasatospora sp. NBC_00240]|uniref:tyrosine-protein phosphatase n=1 Tax=Kitasatospora sp. NBC_00240 TaxID=2903567 RepID=UPI002259C000|nr:tyrosine-protein phosphatase [Kitasatospora sp. NBC_00240]MCX5215033.1 tyrosine-protein phosphatase [Kitasatospora sp. NBC_00240]
MEQRTAPALTGVRNFRDVGGLPAADGRAVRPGLLLRSGHLAHATPEDVAALVGLGLRSVIDLRGTADLRAERMDVPVPGSTHRSIALTDPAAGAKFHGLLREGDLATLRAQLGDGGGEARMVAAYRNRVVTRTAEHALILRVLAEPDGVPALIHCSAGKDRAGWAIAVVLLALGVPEEAILADYLASNGPAQAYRFRRADGSVPEPGSELWTLLRPAFEARPEYLRAAWDTVREHWRTPEAYLREGLGLTDQGRRRLRELLLTEARTVS